MKFMKMSQALLFVLALVIAAGTAQANEARLLSTHGDWKAYTFQEDGNKVCFMASKPKSDQGNYSQRGEIFVLITHRPAEGSKNVFSYIAGYPYQTGSDATVTIDGKNYTLFTQDDTAWAPDASADNKLLDAIRKGSKMSVKGTSSRGTATTDTFSLKGSSGAYDAISRECGL
jgi:invasion protein IalB